MQLRVGAAWEGVFLRAGRFPEPCFSVLKHSHHPAVNEGVSHAEEGAGAHYRWGSPG